jgi:hypothetical protein
MHQLSDCSKIKPLPPYYVPKSGYANDDGTNGNAPPLPAACSAEETDACFIVRDGNEPALAYVTSRTSRDSVRRPNCSPATTRPGTSPPTSPSRPTPRRSACVGSSLAAQKGPVVGLSRLDPGPDLRRGLARSRVRFASSATPPTIATNLGLCHRHCCRAEAQDREKQEQATDARDHEELRPDHANASAAIKYRLRKQTRNGWTAKSEGTSVEQRILTQEQGIRTGYSH